MYIGSLRNQKRTSSVKRPMAPPPKPAPKATPSSTTEKAIWSSVSLQQHYAMEMRVTTQHAFPSVAQSTRSRLPPSSSHVRSGSTNDRSNGTDVMREAEGQVVEYEHRAPQPSHPPIRYISKKALEAAAAMGLVEIPPPPPDKLGWEAIQAQQQTRAANERAGSYSCSICMERFITDSRNPQVLLDCAHVFHKTCLEQFEKFVHRAREKKSCPLCRKTHYHKRILIEGPSQLRVLAAVKIQATYRGYLARKRFQKLQWRAFPDRAADYAYEQLKGISDKYLARAVAREKEVDEIIERMDLERQKALAEMMSARDWEAIRERILVRATTLSAATEVVQGCCGGDGEEGVDCPICLSAVVGSDGIDHSSNSAVMLSCSHFFHRPCLDAFERIRESGAIPRCPVCRAAYSKMAL